MSLGMAMSNGPCGQRYEKILIPVRWVNSVYPFGFQGISLYVETIANRNVIEQLCYESVRHLIIC